MVRDVVESLELSGTTTATNWGQISVTREREEQKISRNTNSTVSVLGYDCISVHMR